MMPGGASGTRAAKGMMMTRVSIIVPVYNEKTTADILLKQVLAFNMPGVEKEIVIVEGNSTDGTRQVVEKYSGNPEVKILYEDGPCGRGAAICKGFEIATGEVVFFQDADLEYSVADYPAILGPVLSGEADVVIGSRTNARGQQTWQFREFSGMERFYGFVMNLGGLLYTGLFNVLYGTSFLDGCAMFKVFRKKVLKEISIVSKGFDFDWELQGKLVRKGYRFAEVPVSYKARGRGEGKKICFWRDGWKVFLAIVRFRFAKIKL